jgi:exopolysaccharide biosynthesis polyprenyl glycosylphosphotransferase
MPGSPAEGTVQVHPSGVVPPTDAQVPRSVVASTYGRRDYLLRRLLAVADACAIVGAILIALLAAARPDMLANLFWAALTIPMWLVVFKIYGLYDRDSRRVSHTTIDDIPRLFHALLVGSLLLWAYYKWAAPPDKLVLQEVVLFGAGALGLILALRSAVRRITRKIVGAERVLLVGDRQPLNLVSKLHAHPEYGLKPVGVVSPKPGLERHPGLAIVEAGRRLSVEQLVRDLRIDRIVISDTELQQKELLELLRGCREFGIKVSVLPELFDVMGSAVEIDDVEGVTVLGLNPTVLPKSSAFLKRALDVLLSAAILLASAPLLVLVAVSIKLDSPGPVFFRQERIGRAGSRFTVIKLRTMVRDAEGRREELRASSSDPGWVKLERDPRVTRVGRLLRLSSLDELPQLWNVLKGEMSLVGPRPLIEDEDRHLDGWARSRLDLTPGITGLWQVLGRTDIPFSEMIKLDYLYVTNWSLWGDVRLILRTLPVVISRRGAN